MTFHPGDHVLVELLGKGVVREVRGGGRCLVEIKGRSLILHEQQLSAVENPGPRASRSASGAQPIPALPTRAHAPASLDLHGMTAADAVTALDNFINDAILAGLAEARVIHGRTGGRLKAAVHGRLKTLPSVRAFRLDPRNPGVTIVTL